VLAGAFPRLSRMSGVSRLMNFQVRLIAGCLAGCTAVAVVSACGSGTPAEPGATALTTSMQQAVRGATSVHFDGQESEHGIPVGVDTGISRSGDVSGTVTDNGANVQVLGVGGKAYIKVTPELLKQVKAPASSCSIVCGRWAELPANEAGQLTGQLTMSNLTGSVATTKLPKFTEDGSTTVNGQPAWVLRAANGATLDVSSVGKPYPLKATPGSGGHGVIKYSQWNAVPKPAAPPAGQVINLTGLH
jgi:hypothetical protein